MCVCVCSKLCNHSTIYLCCMFLPHVNMSILEVCIYAVYMLDVLDI